jgi:hypothetical protein
MSDEREQILSTVDYWRLHANNLKAEGGFAHMPVTDLRTILDHIDTLTRERDEAVLDRDAALHALSGDWCDECDSSQYVLPDGSHDCSSNRELRAQRDEARVVTDAMVERAARVILSRHIVGKDPEEAWQFYGDDFKHEARAYLTAALSEAT